MAFFAALFERFMHFITEYCFVLAAVRVVAGEALGRLFGEVWVCCLQGAFLVTGETEFICRCFEQVAVVCLMGLVAGGTITFGIWCMRVFELFW